MIRVDKDYVIRIEGENYIPCEDLHTVTKLKDGTDRHNYATIGYYSTLYKACIGIRDYKLRKSLDEDEKTLLEALNELKRLNKEFEDKFEKLIGVKNYV